ncbi:Hypothetical predicted protein [Olea europaea subsp. europaea]|uniref:peptidylprolyl isomerase n=1 Tax=Olea europaea subsp. europaea TaxID=158383 RepID=A0A8S0SIF2_OLEEU|nr:Hypothetical predicted protein [Olea europaea subsp. europaea]
MAFWGTEVKPGKPVTHSSGTARGRLRISQATLGIGDATKTSLVQCNVGNKSPVLLCALLPNKTESCHLDLEFEEAVDVVFSVIGPRSVYLTGYYVNHSRHFNPHSDSESFGVDIEHTGTEGSNHCSDDDKYEDSFIDDGELRDLSPSHISDSDEIKETMLEHGKPKGNERSFKRHKKKYQVIESDDDANPHESEDEDSYLLSVFRNRRAAQTTKSEAGEKTGKGTVETSDKLEDGGTSGSVSKGKPDDLDVVGEPEREAKLPHNTVLPSNGQDPIMDNGKDQIQSLALVKPKRKRRERFKEEEETLAVENGNCNGVLGENKEQEAVVKSDKMDPDLHLRNKTYQGPSNAVVDGDCSVPPAEMSSENCRKSKKQRKEIGLEGSKVEGNGASYDNNSNGVEFKLDIAKSVGMSKDLQATNGKNKEPTVYKDIGINSHLVGSQSEKKLEGKQKKKNKNKNKNKSQRDGDSNIGTLEINANEENTFMKREDWNANVESSQQRTLSSGLIIEEVAKGEPGGKIAAPGKKVMKKLLMDGTLASMVCVLVIRGD